MGKPEKVEFTILQIPSPLSMSKGNCGFRKWNKDNCWIKSVNDADPQKNPKGLHLEMWQHYMDHYRDKLNGGIHRDWAIRRCQYQLKNHGRSNAEEKWCILFSVGQGTDRFGGYYDNLANAMSDTNFNFFGNKRANGQFSKKCYVDN